MSDGGAEEAGGGDEDEVWLGPYAVEEPLNVVEELVRESSAEGRAGGSVLEAIGDGERDGKGRIGAVVAREGGLGALHAGGRGVPARVRDEQLASAVAWARGSE